MGILSVPAGFVQALKLPRGFSVCELGDQWLTQTTPKLLARTWYQSLGCGKYIAIDGNGRGDVTADLNRPLPDLGEFDLVTDFGTGEHVFDQAQVWRSLHALTRPGGYIAFDRPTQGYPTHCYYLTDPCLFHDLAAANGYDIVRIEAGTMPRGSLTRGVFRTPDTRRPFVIPQQGRYHRSLKI